MIFAAFAAQARANLISNGSFEEPVVPVGSFSDFAAGSTGLTGWKVVGIDSAVVSTSFKQLGITFNAEQGNQWIDLSGITSTAQSSGVSQTVATTIGDNYLLTFYVGSTTDAGHTTFFPSTVDLSIDGGARAHYTNTDTPPTTFVDWKLSTVDFTATSSTTNLQFLNGSASNNNVTALDNVQLVDVSSAAPVPEPSTLALSSVLVGVLGVAWSWRRTRRRDRTVEKDHNASCVSDRGI
jgi:hypothetical protein